MSHVIEGFMPYCNHKTYYRIVEPDAPSHKASLLCLHGGPGSTHNYFEVLDRLADEDGRKVIMYDQIGCGNSYLDGQDPSFWTPELWLDELEALRKHLKLEKLHMIGQSWGGMMEIAYAVDRNPEGVLSYVLSSANPSSSMWEQEGRRRIRMMSSEDQKAISDFLAGKIDASDPDYLSAVDEYMKRYCNPTIHDNMPECIVREKKTGNEAYAVAWGSNEFCPTGPLADFEYLDKLHLIQTDCLVCSGIQDLCSPLIAKAMYDRLPHAKWNLYPNSHHVCYVDDHEQYIADLIEWLNEYDR